MGDLRITNSILAIIGVFLVTIQCSYIGVMAAEDNKPQLSPIVLSKHST